MRNRYTEFDIEFNDKEIDNIEIRYRELRKIGFEIVGIPGIIEAGVRNNP